MVKAVDEAKGVVMVEWTENNATKRKEASVKVRCNLYGNFIAHVYDPFRHQANLKNGDK